MVTKDGLAKIPDFGLAKQNRCRRGPPTGSTVTTENVAQDAPRRDHGGTAGYMSPEQVPVANRSTFTRTNFPWVSCTLNQPVMGLVRLPRRHGHRHVVGDHEPGSRNQSRGSNQQCPRHCGGQSSAASRKPPQNVTSRREISHANSPVSAIISPKLPDPASNVVPPKGAKRLTRRKATRFGRPVGLLMVVGALLLFRARPVKTGTSVRFHGFPSSKHDLQLQYVFSGAACFCSRWPPACFWRADPSGKDLLWTRSLDSLEARVLPGTDGATYPFWSPDSASIGYFAHGKLMKIAVDGGPPQTLCSAPEGRGGSWGSEGVIVFAPDPRSPIARVSVAWRRCRSRDPSAAGKAKCAPPVALLSARWKALSLLRSRPGRCDTSTRNMGRVSRFDQDGD